MNKIRVLVIEDSLTVRRHLVSLLTADPTCEVVGESADGQEAALLCQALRPDVVTLDMMLQRSSGVEVTEQIMAYCPTPIVIVSASINRGEALKTLHALAAGALEVIEKPRGADTDGAWARAFVETIRIASRIKVVTHVRGMRRAPDEARAEAPAALTVPVEQAPRRRLIAVGASTGGPTAVTAVLGNRKHPISLPVLLVIHIGRPFGAALADWLRTAVPIPSSQAEDGEPLPAPHEPRVLVAPADRHLVVRNHRIRLTSDAERNGCRPSVDVLFDSVAREIGPGAVGCLLTGMGRDGAAGLLAMKRAGAMTFAQDEASSVVFGMPKEAIHLGAASRVVGLQEMARQLSALPKVGNEKGV